MRFERLVCLDTLAIRAKSSETGAIEFALAAQLAFLKALVRGDRLAINS
jgi:hypothetical protein